MTETAPILAINSNFLQVAGSVGTFAAGVEAKFLRDGQAESTSQNQGEVLVRCPNLMLGYYEDKAATQAAIDRMAGSILVMLAIWTNMELCLSQAV